MDENHLQVIEAAFRDALQRRRPLRRAQAAWHVVSRAETERLKARGGHMVRGGSPASSNPFPPSLRRINDFMIGVVDTSVAGTRLGTYILDVIGSASSPRSAEC